MARCILYQNEDVSVSLLDIPTSIEVAQGETAGRRLVSSKPVEQPYPSVEPKSTKALSRVQAPSIKELLLYRHLQLVLDEIKASQKEWFLPRIVGEIEKTRPQRKKKRQKISGDEISASVDAKQPKSENNPSQTSQWLGNDQFAHSNPEPVLEHVTYGPDKVLAWLPPKSTFINGAIEDTLTLFHQIAPPFNLMILDPPWPNRSAQRSQSYSISSNTPDILSLLSSLPIRSHLSPCGMLGIWVTNKSAFHDMLLGEGGIFEEWGVKLREEWIWLKVTGAGEPICAIESVWRKPYEVLLVGFAAGQNGRVETGDEVKRRVIVGVPDLHSRKPNLKTLFEPMLPPDYEALEIFARNLTTGWWAWGNEVLKYQTDEHWTSP